MADPIVTTRSGRISGETRSGLHVFRGIPYAQAPRDSLRWQAPQPVEPWSGIRNTQDWAASAPQSPAVMMLVRRLIGVALREQSQDCLHLNVWAPKARKGRRPVLVWIHGGAFIMGSGSTNMYDGASLAREGDVVVVTLNYRLGALGFLSLRDVFPEQASSNLGLRDQIAALEWVRDNVEAFGGDPENVTIFGESAGGMSVSTLLGTPAARGLFHRAIAQSGAAHNVSSRQQASHVAECFLDELGSRSFGALEKASVSELIDAQQRTAARMGLATGTLPWQPSVDDDLIPEQPLASVAAGRGAQVPLMIGTNVDEWRLFMLGDAPGRRLDDQALRRRLVRVLPKEDESAVERTIQAYQGATAGRGHETPTDVWVAFQSDRIFHYPAHSLARAHSLHVPDTYTYLFDWSPPLVGNAIGACHGIEIPFVFGSYSKPVLRPLIGFGRDGRRLSNRMMSAWIRFARKGDPNHSGLPVWPTYDPETRSTLTLGRKPRVLHNPFAAALELWARIDPLTRMMEEHTARADRDGGAGPLPVPTAGF
ncbi:MAG: carboxylesterase family protein [bacterium]|nr:carboxylesterase family protein [bacterium]